MTDKDFYSPAEIIFSRPQIIWIIEHLDGADKWPSDFKVTGYSGKKKGGINKRAYFEAPKIIIAEVERRLEFTKTDGKLLKKEIKLGTTVFELLEPESQNALNFVSLWDFRKRPRYYEWKKWRKYYFKKISLPKGSKNNKNGLTEVES